MQVFEGVLKKKFMVMPSSALPSTPLVPAFPMFAVLPHAAEPSFERHDCRFYVRVYTPMTATQFKRAVSETLLSERYKPWFVAERRRWREAVSDLMASPGDDVRDTAAGNCCGVCLVEDSEVRRLKACGHEFHASCLHSWIAQGGSSCPLCRAAINIV